MTMLSPLFRDHSIVEVESRYLYMLATKEGTESLMNDNDND